MTEKKPAAATKDAEQKTISFTRTVKSSAADAFRAWTEPERLKKWFGPSASWKTTRAEVDPKDGGKYLVEMKSPKNETFTLMGVYKGFEPAKRLSFTWKWKEEEAQTASVVDVLFKEAKGACEVVVNHTLKAEDAGAELTESWNGVLDRLVEHF